MDTNFKFKTRKGRRSPYFTLLILSVFLLSACSPIPLSVIVYLPQPLEVKVNGATDSFDPNGVPTSETPVLDERSMIQVEDVNVRIGQGSPIPVDIVISGTWPDLCAQISDVHSVVKDFQIEVTILASKSASCPLDQLGLPFLFELPLNAVELPDGVYTISVNGNTGTILEIPLKP